MYTTVLFDLDGTLLDTLQDIAAAANHALESLGLPTHPVPAYRHMVGSGVNVLIQRMLPPDKRGQATSEVALALYRKHYNVHMNDFTRPYPGILEMLAKLKAASVQMGVLSNKTDARVQEMVAHYFPNTFEIAMGLRPEFSEKPDPASTLHMLQALGAQKQNTLYCGDSDIDMQTAHNAGLAGCGVAWGFRGEEELKNAGATFIAQNTDELYHIIRPAL